ncbi:MULTISPECIES: bifunctional phosphopantothenoylcysteine decarboxylase/phosphopantothenate--cysteine ligase CoaBC [unclassified Corynebacterium]|uniref:bifunctional phosphopantothenoylcysteine decarboxylase/phosphopantothenate--cysteine ligase CoaBC n=1 Tax=unclassified Corynebacterium TaxID=2624378 RepID=UPI002169FC6C|nr:MULTISPECIES: bifunctional phosphopantothenoylcysteine decarboxylase/phosphopantothenate--cysteine ligase CoaBC [unclassified Corynebacterium]MCS4489272.1 bifunctional phosphopantothenoylcysteine decarboxylase/phosphopantothenate--cysteine ligase CoaBC [Corynebacterium sp. ES2775-CONJ]MCS4531034.1 bifunctional phosphopantothenoylcysteine decarboxylase/phosphopantothenate--cysteine ligase CoaBC [Corynebacterium sp. ES2730-CONJ]
MSTPRTIVIGVAGGIAAYKACALIRHFKECGDDVIVVPTEAALQFVGSATFEALSGNPVATSVFENVAGVQHIRIGQQADLIIVAPATADLLARVASGRADDLLAATILVSTCPVVFAPAMHTEMWENAATVDNVAVLRSRGYVVLNPAHGRLTGKDSGPGRLLEPLQIAELARSVGAGVHLEQSLVNRKIVITAGGTKEAIDPVRFISNHSSGRQGYALGEIAAQRGANVVIIAGNTQELPVPAGARLIIVESALDMHQALTEELADADVLIMAAAVSDYRPAQLATTKLKKDGSAAARLTTIEMVENPDILASVVEQRDQGTLPQSLVIVGFAAETGDSTYTALDYGLRKLAKKGCDLMMLNEVGSGKVFGQTTNAGYILHRDGHTSELAQASKAVIASAILDSVESHLETRSL